MAEAARYMFDRTFDVSKGPGTGESAAIRKLNEDWERKLAEARAGALEEGRAEGKAEALKGIEEQTRAQVEALLDGVSRLLGAVEKETGQIRHNAIEIASMSANLLAGELIARTPTLALEALFADALEHMGDAPHVALTVNDTLAARVKDIVTAIAAERAFPGKIAVLGDPETRQGDCSLQWADGGIALDFEKTRDEVARIVRRHLQGLSPQTQKSNGSGAPHRETEQRNPTGTGAGAPALPAPGEPQ